MCLSALWNSMTVWWTHIISSTDGQLACLCDSPKCLQATPCHGTRCFSSVKVSSSGVVFERGCLEGPEKTRLLCSTAPSFHQAIFCCSHDMCNSNTSTSSLMSLLPTGGYYITAVSNKRTVFCTCLLNNLTFNFSCTSFNSALGHSPRGWAGSVSRGDLGSLCARPRGGSGSAVCSICAGLQEAAPRPSAEAAGVRHRAGSYRWPHHLQCGRQHFSGKIERGSDNRDNKALHP